MRKCKDYDLTIGPRIETIYLRNQSGWLKITKTRMVQMPKIFNYNTIDVTLTPETKTMSIFLNRPDVGNKINQEMAFELESILAWATSHIEIHSIYFTGNGEYFCQGFDDDVYSFSPKKLGMFTAKIRKIIYSMFYLPQTIICNFKKGATGVGVELGLASDVRIAEQETTLDMDHLTQGLVPNCGGIGFLQTVIPHSLLRNWITLGAIDCKKLEQCGFLSDLYYGNESKIISRYTAHIAMQSPTARIQAKRTFLQSIMPQLEYVNDQEEQFTAAAYAVQDYKAYYQAKENNGVAAFRSPMEIASELKKAQQG